MKESNIAMVCVAAASVIVAGGIAGWVGYRIGKSDSEPAKVPVAVPAEVAPAANPAVMIMDEPDPFPAISDSDIEELIAETEVAAPAAPPGFNPEEMEARRKRWESMSMEQRTMMRKSMFAALAKVDGLEEVGDAIREGKIDPRQFNLNPAEIADRMEIHAELMDQEAMETEVTRTLQNIVDQARSKLK